MMRPIYGCPEKFWRVPEYAHAYFSRNFNGLLFRSILWMCVQNLNFVPLPVPEIIWSTFKKLGSPWIRPRCLFSKIFNGLLFGWTLGSGNVSAKFEVCSFTPSWDNSDSRFGRGLWTPNLGEVEVVGGRGWYRSKERWWAPIGPS